MVSRGGKGPRSRFESEGRHPSVERGGGRSRHAKCREGNDKMGTLYISAVEAHSPRGGNVTEVRFLQVGKPVKKREENERVVLRLTVKIELPQWKETLYIKNTRTLD